MLGHIVFVTQKGRRPVLVKETVHGLTLLRAAVPALPGASPGSLRRRIGRAAKLLHQAGVHRVLAPTDFSWWAVLGEWDLLPVDIVPCCQALASRLALASLERRGTTPDKATVALRGSRVSRPFFQAAMELAPLVRGMVIASPNGGEALSAYLRREYGVPILEEGPSLVPSLTVEFSPLPGGLGERLVVHGPPALRGIKVELTEGAWPADFAPLPLAAALWEEGHLSLTDLFCT